MNFHGHKSSSEGRKPKNQRGEYPPFGARVIFRALFWLSFNAPLAIFIGDIFWRYFLAIKKAPKKLKKFAL
jgi:hypothetical protein